MPTWSIEFSPTADKQLDKLDWQVRKQILRYMENRVASNPRLVGRAMTGNRRGLWRYTVGHYRAICDIQDGRLLVLVLYVGHRREIYR